jgi:phosphoenolpyruvate-protein phosphotransferase (PTS system enzyme I)
MSEQTGSKAITGLGVSPGVVSGPVARMAAPVEVPSTEAPVLDPAAAVTQAHMALGAAAADLERRATKASDIAAGVLTAQAMMALDPLLAGKVKQAIEAGQGVVAALTEGFAQFRRLLEAAGGYMAERVADLDDVRNRAIAHALGVKMPDVPSPGHPFVLVAEDLSPAETATLNPAEVLAIVTVRGGPTSHTAILAKAMGVPAIVACPGAEALKDDQTVLVDGSAGTIEVDPDEARMAEAEQQAKTRKEALARSTGPGQTADGHKVQLLVNLGAERDLEAAAAADSEGVGLFRTEFLFLDRPEAPTVEEQQSSYARVFEAFASRKVVVRTIDAGADKPLRFATQPDEPNPALGVRGLRVSRLLPNLLEDQLEAIARAAKDGQAQVWVMAPMVSTLAEASAFAQQARGHGLSTAGIMIEVPGAALRSSQIAPSVDFFSIGTNDLSQYTMASDRENTELADLLDRWQPAVLDLVKITGEGGRSTNKPVGVCGEAASDPYLALVLVGLGVTSLSMAPVSLAEVRLALAAHTLEQCQQLAEKALAATDAVEAKQAVREAAQPF